MPRYKTFGKSSRKRIQQNICNLRKRKRKKRLKLLEGAAGPSNAPPDEEQDPEPVPEPRKAFRVPSPSELTEGRGKRSCRVEQCAFRSCPTNDSPDLRNEIKLFRFPKAFHAGYAWGRVVSRDRGEPFTPQFTSLVCSLHFRSWEIFEDDKGRARVVPDARPRAQPYTQEEQEIEIELFKKRQEERAKVNEEGDDELIKIEKKKLREEKKRMREEKRRRIEEKRRIREEKKRMIEERKRMREERKRMIDGKRKIKKTAEIVLPIFVPELPNSEIKEEFDDESEVLKTSVDGFGYTLPVEQNPLKIDESTELERAVQSLADELKPTENAITLQYLDLNSQSATVHYLSVDSGLIVSVGHTQVDIEKDKVATLNYVNSDNTVTHTLRCVNIEDDPSIDTLTGNETSINKSVVNTVAPVTDLPNISNSVNSITNNDLSASIKVEPIINDESDQNITNDGTVGEVIEETVKVKNESDASDSEVEVKMEIEELDEQGFKLF